MTASFEPFKGKVELGIRRKVNRTPLMTSATSASPRNVHRHPLPTVTFFAVTRSKALGTIACAVGGRTDAMRTIAPVLSASMMCSRPLGLSLAPRKVGVGTRLVNGCEVGTEPKNLCLYLIKGTRTPDNHSLIGVGEVQTLMGQGLGE